MAKLLNSESIKVKDLLKEYYELDQAVTEHETLIKPKKKRMEDLKKLIFQAMGTKTELKDGKYFALKSINITTTFNKKALQLDHPKIYEKYTGSGTSTRFEVLLIG